MTAEILSFPSRDRACRPVAEAIRREASSDVRPESGRLVTWAIGELIDVHEPDGEIVPGSIERVVADAAGTTLWVRLHGNHHRAGALRVISSQLCRSRRCVGIY